MTVTRVCPECKGELPDDAPGDVCSKCSLVHAIATVANTPPPDHQASTVTFRGHFVPPTPEELAGHFPHLEIQQLLGEGGMGAVYKARQPGLDRIVALKILPAEAGRDPAFAERFTREARALAKLNHPNIITIYDFGQSGELYYFIMEFVDGANLRQLLRNGYIRPDEALRIVPQICEALQYAHEEGFVHRDIKPENILLDKKGRVRVADFGIAKLMGRKTGEHTLTGPWQVMGTLHYMAPEQMADPLHVDHRADLYSLGVVFYEMLTGQLPLGRFAPPSQKTPIDVRLDQVVLRALESEPGRRYQHASEIKTDVATIARGSAAEATVVEADEPQWQDADLDLVRRKVFWPSLGLVLSGIFSLLPSIYIPIIWLIRNGEPETYETVLIALVMISSIMAGIIVWGGVRMSRLEWLPFVSFASVLAMVPFTIGCFVGFPAGLWAFMVLRDPNVIAAFRGRPLKTSRTLSTAVAGKSQGSDFVLRPSVLQSQSPSVSPASATPVRLTPVPPATAASQQPTQSYAVVTPVPASRQTTHAFQKYMARARLKGPSIALAIVGALNLLGSKKFESLSIGLPSVAGLSMVAAILMLIAARRMYQLRNYKAVRWISVATFLPFVSPTFPFSIAVGVWCVNVLNKPEIREAFDPD